VRPQNRHLLALATVAVLVVAGVVAVDRHLISEVELIFYMALIPSIILHEVSHGLVAYWCGDDTAKRAGRLTLDPISHVDPIGTIILPIVMLLTTGFAFGYAKPVPVSINRLRHPRNQAVLVALAGPATNFILAGICAIGFRLFFDPYAQSLSLPLLIFFYAGFANVLLGSFNLIPIPPLDGSAVVERLLPEEWMPSYYRFRQMALVLILILVLFGEGLLTRAFSAELSFWTRVAGLN
jgi:Zn-dependent protease